MLAADRLAWWVELHHDTHTHPFQPRTEGVASGTFAVPTRGHTETNIWLRLYLEARDAQGVADTAWVDLPPRTVTLSFVTAAGATSTVSQDRAFNVQHRRMERDWARHRPAVGLQGIAFKSCRMRGLAHRGHPGLPP
jgi:hypothetical protein